MCIWGDTVKVRPPSKCLAPNRINNDTIQIDRCLVGAVLALWQAGYATTHACCGHGKGHGDILVVGKIP
jgi:hypothetical protein